MQTTAIRRTLTGLSLLAAATVGPVAQAQVGGSPGETGIVLQQNGATVPLSATLTAGGDPVLTASLESAPFALLFPLSSFPGPEVSGSAPEMQLFLSEDPKLFAYVRQPHFRDRFGPAHGYAIPRPGDQTVVLTDVDFADHMTAHNTIFEYRWDIAKAGLLGTTIASIIEPNEMDRLDSPLRLYAVAIILQAPPTWEEADPAAGPEALTPALVDYLVLDLQ